jgi:outer membrane receptor protein involved in Fe transport
LSKTGDSEISAGLGVEPQHLSVDLPATAWGKGRLNIGVRNLFNRDSPASNAPTSQAGYDPAYADPRGRFWTLGLNWKLR